MDRVIGFELGADDYVTKPFSPRELILRVKSILRKRGPVPEGEKVIQIGDLLIDIGRHQVWLETKPIQFTSTEFKLLVALSSSRGRVKTRENLLDQVWGYTHEGYARTVDTHVRRLRDLVGMGDPIRPGVKELISAFHQTGIDTIMITGDQTPTAFAIGKELNLSRGEQLEILDSTHLISIDPDVMKALCERVQVFSRVTPAHKLQIVHALQKAGRVVAMTGDGINDGPALKAADIGVAMGRTGTDVAREVADVVLEDDNLQTMVVAISQGRTIYNNIRKTVHYLLATHLSEIMVITAAIMGGLGQPLNAMQLLWINLISDIFPGLALALEPPEPDVLSQPPRDPNEPIIQTKDFKRIGFEAATLSAGAMGAYGYGIVRYGSGPQASTLAFMSLSMGQILHALSCRSRQHSLFDRGVREKRLQPNRYLNLAVGGTLALQMAAPVVPGLRGLLGIAPIGPVDGLVIGASAFWPLIVNEMTKGRRPRG